MGERRLNPRLAKINRNYTVEEVARTFGVHKNTVREWIRRGLPTTDGRRPTLILGRDLGSFIRERRTRNKKKCQPGELYCVRCRAPKAPAGRMADYCRITETLGNLVALCPDCDGIMNRRISASKLELIRQIMDVTMPQAVPHIADTAKPCANCDFG